MTDSARVRVRFAPSPTGFLHVGGARSALFNYLFARHCGGTFILRIEDTDRKRFTDASVEDFVDSLRWLGILWDEGPEAGGDYGPYYQSERLGIYQKYAEELLQLGAAYKCYCPAERLTVLREDQAARKLPPGYDRHCRNLTRQQAAECEAGGIVPVIRLKVPLDGRTGFHDLIRGEITVDNSKLEDMILVKSDGYPTYHLANVVDDHLMEISHILRADEWIASTPSHQLLYAAFGWKPPVYAHLPVILDPSGKGKMSKRKKRAPDGREYNVLVREFRDAGYLPEALFNFLALIGWSYDDRTEILTPEQVIARFDITNISASPAAFNYQKLDDMNGVYMRALTPDDLASRLQPVLAKTGMPADTALARRIAPLVQERIKTLNDAIPMVDFFFSEPASYDAALLAGKLTREQAGAALTAARKVLENTAFDEALLDSALRSAATAMGLKAGPFFTPIRVAVTGKTIAPPLFGTLMILGRQKVLARIDRALALLLGSA